MGGVGAPGGTVPPSMTVTVIVGSVSLPSSSSPPLPCVGTGFDGVVSQGGIMVRLSDDEGGATLVVFPGGVTVTKTVLTAVVTEPASLLAGGGGAFEVDG